MQKARGQLFTVLFEKQWLPRIQMDPVFVLGWDTDNHVSLLLKLRLLLTNHFLTYTGISCL